MKIVLALACLLLAAIVIASAKDPAKEVHGDNRITLPAPPATEVKPVTDMVGGMKVTDNYRWLEDAKSPETRAWVIEQERYTQKYLAQVKRRPQIVERLTQLERVESYSIPVERAGDYFFKKRLADENQASIYMRRGLHGQDERLVDATKLSTDQNTSVRSTTFPKMACSWSTASRPAAPMKKPSTFSMSPPVRIYPTPCPARATPGST